TPTSAAMPNPTPASPGSDPGTARQDAAAVHAQARQGRRGGGPRRHRVPTAPWTAQPLAISVVPQLDGVAVGIADIERRAGASYGARGSTALRRGRTIPREVVRPGGPSAASEACALPYPANGMPYVSFAATPEKDPLEGIEVRRPLAQGGHQSLA